VTPRTGTVGTDSGVDDARMVDALVQLSFAVHAALVEVGSEHDLSVTQVRLLGVLRDRTVGMAEVAAYLGLDRSSVTGLVSRAETRDLVRRSPSPHDGRGVLVGLSPHGKTLVRQAVRDVQRRLLVLTETLDAADRARLTTIIERVLVTA
jgi:DNA-binding MarR family transcriptional regulator